MKVIAVYGPGHGTHPCAGSGWKVQPETPMEERVLKEVFGVRDDFDGKFHCIIAADFPEALTAKRTDSNRFLGGGEYEYFIHRCHTTNVGGNPHCAGSPKGALEVAQLFLRACARLCANAKYTEAPSMFTQV
jgi:hypothetical protein